MLCHYYYFKSLQSLKTINIQELQFYIWTVQFLQKFYEIDRFVMGASETSLWSLHLYFFKNKLGIHACVVSNFHLGLEKMSITLRIEKSRENLEFSSVVEISSRVNSVYRVEIFTCNCNVTLKRSLLFSRDEIWSRFNKLKFQPRMKISI